MTSLAVSPDACGGSVSAQTIAELKQSQQILELIFATQSQRFFWKDRESRFLGCSRNVLEDAGLETLDEIIGKTDYDMVWAENAEAFCKDDAEVMNQGISRINYEECQRRENDVVGWLRTSKVPLKNETGEIVGIFGVYEDITAMKATEAALRDSEIELRQKSQQLQDYSRTLEKKVEARTQEVAQAWQFLELAMNTLPLAIFWKNTELVYQGCNQAFATAAGLAEPSEIRGKTDYDLPWTSVQADWFRECDRHRIDTNTAEIGIIEPMLQADGQQTWLETNKVPLCNGEGDVIGLLGSFQDITARKRAEEELRALNLKLKQAKETADRASQSKSDFLAKMSHELRTPLNGILGYAQILERSPDLTPKERHGIKIIHGCGNHLLELINEILDLAKIEARKLELSPSPVHFPSFLQNIFEVCQVRAQQKGLSLRRDIPDDLADGLRFDEKCLRQVLLNLMGNAIKFTDCGSVCLRVEQQALGMAEARLTFTVSDTGIGISAADLEFLFNAFEQVGDRDRNAQGTGLGLTISQQMVELMGGTITVESELGVGSQFCFAIDLPLSANDWLKPEASERRHIVGYQGPRQQILIVDDRWQNRDILKTVLEPLGFEVFYAENGAIALDIMAEILPQLVISDLIMPVMDGFELLAQIRRNARLSSVKVVISSASVSLEQQQMSLTSGSDGFLAKPLHLPELFDVLQKHLNLKWVYAEDSPAALAAAAAEEKALEERALEERVLEERASPLPSSELLKELLQYAQEGRVKRFTQQIETVCHENSSQAEYLMPLLELAQQFELERIETLLESSLEKSSEHHDFH